jgi:hypothetical protein
MQGVYMKPKQYKTTNIIIKSFILAFTICVSLFIICFASSVIKWNALSNIYKDFKSLWIIVIFLTGMCCGIVAMWLFYNPDSAWIVSRIDNPAAMAYLFT